MKLIIISYQKVLCFALNKLANFFQTQVKNHDDTHTINRFYFVVGVFTKAQIQQTHFKHRTVDLYIKWIKFVKMLLSAL